MLGVRVTQRATAHIPKCWGPTDKYLGPHCRPLHVGWVSIISMRRSNGHLQTSYTQFSFQLVQNRQRGLILRLCHRHPFNDSLARMVPLFVITQRVDRLLEFLVDFFRYLLLRLGPSSGLQRIASNLKDTFITVKQGLG